MCFLFVFLQSTAVEIVGSKVKLQVGNQNSELKDTKMSLRIFFNILTMAALFNIAVIHTAHILI